MSAVVTSVIAVLGTLLGSALTHAFQQRSTERAERAARLERLRQERLELYGTFAGLLVDFRQAMLHHWFCRHEGRDAEDEQALRNRSFELRSGARAALLRIRLIAATPEVVTVAQEAFTSIGTLDGAADLTDITSRRAAARARIDDFVAAARAEIAGFRAEPGDNRPRPEA